MFQRPTKFTLNTESQQSKDLVGWWPLAGNTQDYSSYQRHGVAVASPVWTPGIIGLGLHCDGTTQYVDLGFSLSPFFSAWQQYTIAMWMKPDGIAVLGFLIGERLSADNFGFGFKFAGNVAGDPMSAVHFGVDDYNSTAASGITAANYAHVAVAWTDVGNVNLMRLYVNGVKSGKDKTASSYNTQSTYTCWLGGLNMDGAISYGFAGILADVRIYNAFLSASEVWQLYNPPTRWDLYEPPRRRLWAVKAAAPPATNRRRRMLLAGVPR